MRLGRLPLSLLLLCYAFTLSAAQDATPARDATPPVVTASARADGVRFAALGPVDRLLLEVYDRSGEAQLYDSGWRAGNVCDWPPVDRAGARLPDGAYVHVVTARDAAGRLSLKQGVLNVEGGAASVSLGESSPAGRVAREESAPAEAGGRLALTSAEGDELPGPSNVTGTGTTGRLTKWANGATGQLSDSLLSESAPSLTFHGNFFKLAGTPTANVESHIIHLDASMKTMGQIAGPGTFFGSRNGPYFILRGNDYSAIPGQRGLAILSGGSAASPVGREGSIQFNTLDQIRMLITPAGHVGIGTTTPDDRLEINGVIRVTTLGVAGSGPTPFCRDSSNQISPCTSSSLRYKAGVHGLERGLDLVRRLRPVTFDWRGGGGRDLGFVAEEVAGAEPLLATRDARGEVEGVKYDRLTGGSSTRCASSSSG